VLFRLEADAPLSFRRTLRSGQAAAGSVDAEIAAMAGAQQAAQGEPGKHDGKAAPEAGAGLQEASADKPEKSDKSEKPEKSEKSEKADKQEKSERQDAKREVAAGSLDDERAESGKSDKTSGKLDAARPEGKPEAKSEAKSEAKPDDKDGKEEKKKSRYTLQLSAFQERGEAETFLSELRNAGYSPYVTPAEVDGKAYYRVRLGTYPSYDDAVKAKAEFERKIGRIAYVTKL
jgi:cell division septation protein DedD